ncbi:MAG: cold-shock protein, partial [Flavobacterium sp.]
GGIDGIKEGDDVEFEIAEGKKGLQAVNVKKA